MKKYIIHILTGAIIIALTACYGQVTSKPNAKTIDINYSKDSTAISDEALTKIYCQAISDYITEVYKMDGTVFDTLYFGKRNNGQPDDFPNIVLPEIIKNTKIRLIDPEMGKKLQAEQKSRVYINLVGWVDENTAEFIFVTFSNGFEHKFDCYIDYKYNTKQKAFDFVKSRIEKFSK